MIEFELNDRTFRFEKPNAMDQLHLSRKLAPLLPALAPVFNRFRQLLLESKEGDLANAVESDLVGLAELAQGFADQLAAMKKEDAEYVFDMCLGVVWVNNDGTWIKFWASSAKMPMVKDLNDPSLLIRLVLRVIKDSLGNFINGFLTNAQEPASKG